MPWAFNKSDREICFDYTKNRDIKSYYIIIWKGNRLVEGKIVRNDWPYYWSDPDHSIGSIRIAFRPCGGTEWIKYSFSIDLDSLYDFKLKYHCHHQYTQTYYSVIISMLAVRQMGDIPREIWKLIGEYL